MPKIDVVIVTYNNADHVPRLIASLAAQNAVISQIFIVDNSPNENTYVAVKAQNIPVWCSHSGGNLGFGAGINRAVAAGNSEWVFVLNPDCYLEKGDILSRLIHQYQKISHALGTQDIILGPQILTPEGLSYPTGRNFPSPLVGSWHALKTLFSSRGAKKYLQPQLVNCEDDCVYADWVSGAAFLVRRSTFEDLGGFSKRYFMYAEDIDLCWRLTQRGGKVLRYDGARVVHIGGASTLGNPKSITWHHLSLAKFLLVSFSGVQRLSLPVVLPGLFFRWLYLQIRILGTRVIRLQQLRCRTFVLHSRKK